MQTTVGVPTIGIAGLLADYHSLAHGDVVSKTSEETAAGIPFGVMLKQGVADDGALLLTAITEKLIGVAVFANIYSNPEQVENSGGPADLGGLTPGTTFAVLNSGRIWVVPEDAVTTASGVFVRAVAAGAEQKGAFRGTADGTDTIDISAYARWITSAGAGAPAIVEIDMTNA